MDDTYFEAGMQEGLTERIGASTTNSTLVARWSNTVLFRTQLTIIIHLDT